MKGAPTRRLLKAGLMLSTAVLPASATAAAQCEAGWAGTVHYARKQSNSRNKVVDRISGKGTDRTDWAMNYDYAAQVQVRAAPGGQSSGLAAVAMTQTSTESKVSTDKQICPHTTNWRSMSGQFVTKSQTKANDSGLEADVTVGLNEDGSYTVGIGLPEVSGTTSGSESSSFSGQCTPKQGVSRSISDQSVTVDSVRFSSAGNDRVQPGNPNSLSGSYSQTLAGVTETLTWNLRRCAGDLRLADLKFEDMRYPTWNSWQPIVEQNGTIDGNIVRLTAIVANDGSEEKQATVRFRDTYQGDKWDGARKDGLLGEQSVTVPAGEQREVVFEWDTSGYAWFDDGRPRTVQRIKAEVADKGKKVDETVRNLKIAPKPVVLVHGLWSNWRAWESWQNILTTAHSFDWKAFPVGQDPAHGRMRTGEEVGNLGPTNTISQNADELARTIEHAQKNRNAWHIDLVAHSMGGLISRRYIHKQMPRTPDGRPQVSHLVMLGTPNMGSRCADIISTPLELAGRSMEALHELRPAVVAEFNAVTTERKGTEFSVLAGNPLTAVCAMFDANDGVVSVPSATWNIADVVQESVLHTSMTGADIFSSFVKLRLAIGPAKARTAGKPSGGATVSFKQQPAPSPASQTGGGAPGFSRLLHVKAGETTTIPLDVQQASHFGLTFTAPPGVAATLTDDKGAVRDRDEANAAEAGQLFRSLFVKDAVQSGKWLLTLRNHGEQEAEIVLSTWPSSP